MPYHTDSVGKNVCTWVRTSEAGLHEALQQGRIEFRGGRGPRADQRAPGPLGRLPEPPSAENFLSPRRAGRRMHPHWSFSVRLPREGPLGGHSKGGCVGGFGTGIPLRNRHLCRPAAR